MLSFQLAWRSLWRNPKRTMITVAAVFLAVLLSTFMSSLQEGTYVKMIDNMVKFYSGYIQVHHPDYWASKSINDTYIPEDSVFKSIGSVGEIILAVPRLESFTLISSVEETRGCALIGIDPVLEDQLTGLSKWVEQGTYLVPGDKGVLLAVNLAKNLGVSTGDTLVLISQGYHGESASALMPVRGILKFPSPQLNGFGAYIDIAGAGEFFGAAGRVTSVALLVKDYHLVKTASRKLQIALGNNYSVKTWDEMQPELVSMIEGDRAGAVIMKGVLYMVVGFGILGTIIMMMAERRKEMGIMVAVGMQKYRLQGILFFESLLIGMLGVLVGTVISIPVIIMLVNNPVPLPESMAEAYESFGFEPMIFFSMIPRVFLNQAITVFGMTLLIAVYPLWGIWKMDAIRAIRS